MDSSLSTYYIILLELLVSNAKQISLPFESKSSQNENPLMFLIIAITNSNREPEPLPWKVISFVDSIKSTDETDDKSQEECSSGEQ